METTQREKEIKGIRLTNYKLNLLQVENSVDKIQRVGYYRIGSYSRISYFIYELSK